MTSPDAGPSFEGRLLPHPDEPAFDQGLQFDVETLVDRRRVLKLLGHGRACRAREHRLAAAV